MSQEGLSLQPIHPSHWFCAFSTCGDDNIHTTLESTTRIPQYRWVITLGENSSTSSTSATESIKERRTLTSPRLLPSQVKLMRWLAVLSAGGVVLIGALVAGGGHARHTSRLSLLTAPDKSLSRHSGLKWQPWWPAHQEAPLHLKGLR